MCVCVCLLFVCVRVRVCVNSKNTFFFGLRRKMYFSLICYEWPTFVKVNALLCFIVRDLINKMPALLTSF